MTRVPRGSAVFMLILTAFLEAAWAAPYKPARGSAERAAILDELRPAAEGQLRPPVEFTVSRLRVEDGWAFAEVEPQRPGGRAIDAAALRLDNEIMDGLTTWALLKKQRGGWTLVEWIIGPTDVAWSDWPAMHGAPRGIFPNSSQP